MSILCVWYAEIAILQQMIVRMEVNGLERSKEMYKDQPEPHKDQPNGNLKQSLSDEYYASLVRKQIYIFDQLSMSQHSLLQASC